MKFLIKSAALLVIIATFSSCATIVSKSSWPLTVSSTPSGAKVEITDKKGVVVYTGNTPSAMTLNSGAGFFAKQSYKVKITLEGYNEKVIPVNCNLNGWYIGNIVFGGVIGLLIVDPATGAMYKLDTEFIIENLISNTSTSESSLRIMDINEIPASMRDHLICIK